MGDVSAATTTHSVVFFYLVYTMENNYSVYQHVTPDGMYYFGATNNIKRRWRGNGCLYKTTALQPYIEKYGWNNIQHIVLFENQSKEDALKIEDSLITTAREDGVCINKQRSGLISKEEGYNKNQMKYLREQNHENEVRKRKEYYEINKDKIKEQQKQYREKNKKQIKEQQKQYYEQNRDKILEQQKQYYETNKDKKLEYKRQYRQKNKDKINEYKRQYRQRKKLEKQLKEVETTLF